jgi:hypothetical protein
MATNVYTSRISNSRRIARYLGIDGFRQYGPVSVHQIEHEAKRSLKVVLALCMQADHEAAMRKDVDRGLQAGGDKKTYSIQSTYHCTGKSCAFHLANRSSHQNTVPTLTLVATPEGVRSREEDRSASHCRV